MNADQTMPDSILVEPQRVLLTRVLDRLIPPSGKLPGAGELGVAGYIDRVAAGSIDLRKPILGALGQIEAAAGRSHASPFTDLSGEHQDAVLRGVESLEPELFGTLLQQAYNGYYSNPKVIQGLGLETRPPQPLGHELEPGDLSALENVRRRGRAYREV